MGLRELKEAAHQQYVKGKFAECVKTYQKVLQLAPRDPNMRVRHAEACRRAGERLQAIASYREAANLLLELGCETRARGALKAALELDPHDIVLQDDVARLTPQAAPAEELLSPESAERGELPMLPPLDGDADEDPFAPHALLTQQTALPPIHRALPGVPPVLPMVAPVVLPVPGTPTPVPARTLPPISRTRATGIAAPSVAREFVAAGPPRMAPPAFKPQDTRAAGTLPPRAMTGGHAPPVLQPMGAVPPALQPPVIQPVNAQAPDSRPMAPPPLPPRLETSHVQAPAAPSPRRASQVTGKVMVPPPPPAEALEEEHDTGWASVTPPAPRSTPSGRAPMEVRRLSPNVLAFRSSPNDGWALIRSRTPFEIHLVEDLENLPPELGDFPVEPSHESAASTMH
jgi:hypothetical protein